VLSSRGGFYPLWKGNLTWKTGLSPRKKNTRRGGNKESSSGKEGGYWREREMLARRAKGGETGGGAPQRKIRLCKVEEGGKSACRCSRKRGGNIPKREKTNRDKRGLSVQIEGKGHTPFERNEGGKKDSLERRRRRKSPRRVG